MLRQMLPKVNRMIIALGKQKDGITTLLAILLIVVGFFQYLEIRHDRRIETALGMLERRESANFVEARTTLLQPLFNPDGELEEAFKESKTYDENLYRKIDDVIHSNPAYPTALLDISIYYSNASACVLDGICARPTICSSLMGEVQDHLDINHNYFAYLSNLRGEDARSLYLHQREFVNYCAENLFFNLYSRTDNSLLCAIAGRLYKLTGWSLDFACSGEDTD